MTAISAEIYRRSLLNPVRGCALSFTMLPTQAMLKKRTASYLLPSRRSLSPRMPFLKQIMPKRSNRAHENPFATGEGTFLVFEKDENHTVLLDAAKDLENPPQDHFERMPPVHAHPTQHEWFHCQEGQIGVVLNGKHTILHAGESAFIKKGLWHTYYPIGNVSRSVVWMEPDDPVSGRNEEFFRNYIAYQGDCRKQGLRASNYQLALMRSQHDMVLKHGRLPLRICQAIEFVQGVCIGNWMLKYKVSYPEYYSSEQKATEVFEPKSEKF